MKLITLGSERVMCSSRVVDVSKAVQLVIIYFSLDSVNWTGPLESIGNVGECDLRVH